MDVQQAFAGVEQHIKAFFESAKEKAEQELPVLGDFVQKASTNPIMLAVAAAVHLPGAPEVMAKIAEEIATLDAALGAAKATGAAEAQQAAAEAAAQPAEPVPAV